jgi:hypothetical protein
MGIFGPIDADGDPNGHSRLEQSGEFSVAVSDDNQCVAAGATLNNGSYYTVAWMPIESTNIKYDSGAANIAHYSAATYADEITATWAGGSTGTTYQFSQWCDYGAAGGSKVPLIMAQMNQFGGGVR